MLMIYYAGKFLQLVGLIALPLGVLLGIEYNSEAYSLAYLLGGGFLFLVGSALARAGGERAD